MNVAEAMTCATDIAQEVYDQLLEQVVVKHVIGKNRKGHLSDKAKERMNKGSHIDHRQVHLMSISGKGGWHPDEQERQKYAKNHNFTLLDHLLSVTRGSIMLAALDWLTQTPDMEMDYLREKLTVMAAIAFLHDADKDLYEELREEAKEQGQTLKTSRFIDLNAKHLEKLMQRYGIEEFLKTVQVMLTPDQILYLLEKVEATQSHRHPPAQLPPRDFEALPLYVRLADKLDGIWVATDSVKKDGSIQKGGMDGVLERLAQDEGCLSETSMLRTGWRAIDVFDPHHPFLLDELQRWLAWHSRGLAGTLPLLETHQDGRLLMLLPRQYFADIVKQALETLCSQLPFQLRLDISDRGVPALYDGQPTHDDLKNMIAHLPLQSSAQEDGIDKLLRIQVEYRTEKLIKQLDDLLGPYGLSPRLPKPSTQKLIKLYSQIDGISDQAQEQLRRAGHLVLLISLKLETKAKDKIPTPAQREEILLTHLAIPRPSWISEIDDDATRRVITALWVTTLDVHLLDAVWGEKGLLKHWLEEVGFRRFITGRGSKVVAEVRRHFQQLLDGQRLFPEEEDRKQGHCLFTDEPVDFEETIDKALGLYGVKVSAFSGRDGRPESLANPDAHTNVSPVCVAEHKLRADVHACQGGKENGVPTLISSPITTGLFGGLRLTNEKKLLAMSVYSLNRLEIKKGEVLFGWEVYQDRYRMARLERLSEKLVDQVNQLRMLLQGALRIGRPLHLFRGLPTSQRAFFYYDAMPRILSELLKEFTDEGRGQALRLEQIPKAIDRLQDAQRILECNGLGYDVLQSYAFPATRFGTVCLIWCHIHDHIQPQPEEWLQEVHREFLTYLKGEQEMNQQQDGALVRLGRSAAGIQKYIGMSDSTSKQMLVFNICLDTVSHARHLHQTDEKSMIYAIAGELETELTRKGEAAARENREDKSLIEGCLAVAELFVKEVWQGVLKGHTPSQRSRRILGSIYRMATLHTHIERVKSKKKVAN